MVKTIANKYEGPCEVCGGSVAAGDGIAVGQSSGRRGRSGRPVLRWVVRHRPVEWAGSPVSGRWVGGCPEVVAAGGDEPVVTRRDSGRQSSSGSRSVVTRFAGGGETFRNVRGRCEDAPCCGCCS